jgi:aldehyde dehydrogenase (NAD+)
MKSTTEPGRDVPVSGQSGAKAPALYRGFNGQYINGSWRPGKLGGVRVDTDPYSGATLAETVMANQDDLDEAYHAAATAQVSWAARLPAERAAVMLRSASIMEARHGEIVDWLIRESGSTRVKAELEWQFVHAVTLEAASLPHRMEGRILPLDEAKKESRAYRQPLGVIGVISPWTYVSVAPLNRSGVGAGECGRRQACARYTRHGWAPHCEDL